MHPSQLGLLSGGDVLVDKIATTVSFTLGTLTAKEFHQLTHVNLRELQFKFPQGSINTSNILSKSASLLPP